MEGVDYLLSLVDKAEKLGFFVAVLYAISAIYLINRSGSYYMLTDLMWRFIYRNNGDIDDGEIKKFLSR
ncbi:hypothetical protein THUN1379_17700 [Paludibacterium sp. THUN1379]|nr:hypothetical protein THUN1379_17700 [Paludibacterium sp. THUN1379]